MNIKEIVKKYLDDNGYDGVVNIDIECGCSKEDFPLCQEACDECEAAYRAKNDNPLEDDYFFTLQKPAAKTKEVER
jgi:hypothetical protein